MGREPTDGPPPGGFLPQGGKKDVGDATAETDGKNMGIYPAVSCTIGGRAGDNGDVHI